MGKGGRDVNTVHYTTPMPQSVTLGLPVSTPVLCVCRCILKRIGPPLGEYRLHIFRGREEVVLGSGDLVLVKISVRHIHVGWIDGVPQLGTVYIH